MAEGLSGGTCLCALAPNRCPIHPALPAAPSSAPPACRHDLVCCKCGANIGSASGDPAPEQPIARQCLGHHHAFATEGELVCQCGEIDARNYPPMQTCLTCNGSGKIPEGSPGVDHASLRADVTAFEARRLRLLVGKPLAEVDRLWRLESLAGLAPNQQVPWSRVGEPVDYVDLEQREIDTAKLLREAAAALTPHKENK